MARSAPTSQFLIAGALQGLTQGILQGMQQRQVNEHNDAILKLSMDKLELDRQQLEQNRAKGIEDTLYKAVDDRNNNKMTQTTIENVSLYNRITKANPNEKQDQFSMLTDLGAMKGINKQPNQSDADFLSGVAGLFGLKIDAERMARNGLPLDPKDAARIQNKIAPEVLNEQFKAQSSFDQNLIKRIDPILKARGEKLEDHFIQFNTNDLKNFVGAPVDEQSQALGQKLPVLLIPKNIKTSNISDKSSEKPAASAGSPEYIEPPVTKISKSVIGGVKHFFGIEPVNEEGETRFLGKKFKSIIGVPKKEEPKKEEIKTSKPLKVSQISGSSKSLKFTPIK